MTLDEKKEQLLGLQSELNGLRIPVEKFLDLIAQGRSADICHQSRTAAEYFLRDLLSKINGNQLVRQKATLEELTQQSTEKNRQIGEPIKSEIFTSLRVIQVHGNPASHTFEEVRWSGAEACLDALLVIFSWYFREFLPTVSVHSPSGREKWPLGSPQNIIWSGSPSKIGDAISKVKIELLEGKRCSMIIADSNASNFQGAGTVPWTVPLTLRPATNYRVKITVWDDKDISGFSCSHEPLALELYPPKVKVISPKRGEVWCAESEYDIIWEAIPGAKQARISNYDIELLLDDAAILHLNSEHFPLDGSTGRFRWHVPENLMQGRRFRIKVTATDKWGVIGNGFSNGTFAITRQQTSSDNHSQLPPTVRQLIASFIRPAILFLGLSAVALFVYRIWIHPQFSTSTESLLFSNANTNEHAEYSDHSKAYDDAGNSLKSTSTPQEQPLANQVAPRAPIESAHNAAVLRIPATPAPTPGLAVNPARPVFISTPPPMVPPRPAPTPTVQPANNEFRSGDYMCVSGHEGVISLSCTNSAEDDHRTRWLAAPLVGTNSMISAIWTTGSAKGNPDLLSVPTDAVFPKGWSFGTDTNGQIIAAQQLGDELVIAILRLTKDKWDTPVYSLDGAQQWVFRKKPDDIQQSSD